ncbi:MAG TPA: IclR family transcriptional regulator [Pusillimonas sp.]
MEPRPASPASPFPLTRVSGTQAIHRAIKVLRCIARSRNDGVGLSVICKQTGLIKSTVHRLTNALISEGLVQQHDQTRRYVVGAECHALGLVASDRFGWHKIAASPVSRLAHETGDAAFFSIRQDVYALCLLREEGSFPLKSRVLLAGDRHPLGVGGGSQAMLAALGDAEVAYCLDQNMPDISRIYPRYTRDILMDLVRQGRKKGYSVNPGMVLPGSWGIGVAIRSPAGEVIGALSIATVESRMNPEREAHLYQLLRKEADGLERYIGTHEPPRAFA